MNRLRATLVAAALVVGACGGGAPPVATDAPTTAPGATEGELPACAAAFDAAAAVDEMADSVSDFCPAVRACRDVDEWIAEFDRLGGAGFSGTAIEVLTNICNSAPEVSEEPLCTNLRSAGDSIGIDEEAICEGTEYPGCVEGVRLLMEQVPGSLIAVCQYPNATGHLVLIDSETEAAAACSADGAIEGSQVVRVIQLPQP